ncbi:MAG: SDR family NAD(P)-dependent oxidoreductase [Bacteroidales bacterium]|nr:SDR family NAD(P)-dependent oxidoreductase [Bacteroidales bacterium]
MKKAIIIGATSGIGKELAKILAENDYLVGITGRREKNLEEIKKSQPGSYLTKSFDCTTKNNIEKLNELVSELGGLDLLVFSSGTGDLNESLDYEIERKTIDLNVQAFTKIVDWNFNFFEKQKKGHLVAISSIAGIRGSRIAPAYNATKAFQINYLEGLRQKAKKTGNPIFVTDIRPGFVDTGMAKGEGQFWVATKAKAAKQIFNLIKREKDIGYVTKRWRLISIILKILPNWIYKRM